MSLFAGCLPEWEMFFSIACISDSQNRAGHFLNAGKIRVYLGQNLCRKFGIRIGCCLRRASAACQSAAGNPTSLQRFQVAASRSCLHFVLLLHPSHTSSQASKTLAASHTAYTHTFVSSVACNRTAKAPVSIASTSPVSRLSSVRRNQALRDWVKQQAGAILDGFSTSFTSPQKAVRGASFLLNLAIVSRQEPLGTELNTQLVSILAHLLSVVPTNDEDALHRYFLPRAYAHV